MDRRFKAFAVAALLPLLAACTESPETVFNWDVNDKLPKPHAQQTANAAQTYVYRGDATSAPAPKPAGRRAGDFAVRRHQRRRPQ
jgi:hypothetical protein